LFGVRAAIVVHAPTRRRAAETVGLPALQKLWCNTR